MDIKTQCAALRAEILATEQKLHSFKGGLLHTDLNRAEAPAAPAPDRGEMIANATLAYRHLEDARMRIGKVIQAFDGGTSVYKQ